MSFPYTLVSGDAQRALEVFSTEFDAALESVDPASIWALQFGLVNSSRNIRTTYPIPISAAGYVERKGDDPMRSLYHRSITVYPKTWTDGIAELASIIEAPDFGGWAGEPGRIARESRRHPNKLVAQLLHDNANLGFYVDQTLQTGPAIPLFSTAHKVNIFDDSAGTFSNNLTGLGNAIDNSLMGAVFTNFRVNVKSANGQPMLQAPTHLCVHPAREQEAKDFLSSDLMRATFLEGGVAAQKNTQLTTNNRWKNILELVVLDELGGVSGVNSSMIYFINASSGAKPWIVQDGGEVEQIVHDKNDALYKATGKVGIRYVMSCSATGALPHAIARVTLA